MSSKKLSPNKLTDAQLAKTGNEARRLSAKPSRADFKAGSSGPRRSRGAVLYLLFIISANPKPAARNLATKLARHAVQLSRTSKR